MYVLGIDAGTTGVMATVYSTSGELVSKSYTEFPTAYPKPGWVEQNPEHWWSAVVEACRGAVKMAGVEEDISAVAVANQRETIVAIGRDGKAVTKAIVWQDRRSSEEAREIAERIGKERLFEITGLNPDPYFSLPKILWWMKNVDGIIDRTWKFMLVHDYIVFRLCGEVVTDFSNASRTMLMDLRKRKWCEEIAEEFNIDLDKMPEIVNSGDVVGEVSPMEAEKLGIGSRAVVVAGGGDQQCSAFGLGVVEEGSVKSTTGTGTFMVAPVNEVDGKGGTILYSAHVVPGRDVAEVSIFTTGSLLAWVRNMFFGVDDYDVVNEEAEKSGVGARGLILVPFFSGAGCPHWNSDARGALFGLTLAHNRGDVARAVMEAVAFEVKTNIEVLEDKGVSVDELRLDGGAAKSRLWNSIFANVCNRKCLVSRDVEATARGAAMLAAIGAGEHTFDSAVEAFTPLFVEINPDPEMVERYEEIYEKYRSLRDSVLTASRL